MFESIAALVNRRGWLIVAGWLGFAAALYATAPAWSTVSRDDDVSFFPPDYPSVIGQKLLERGFPDDIASSSVVVVAERPDTRLTGADFAFVDAVARRMEELRDADPALGVRKVMDYAEVGVGPKLVGSRPDGPGQAVLTVVSLRGTYVSKEARQAVDRILAEVEALEVNAPAGLEVSVTGSAVVGHDSNRAATGSVNATTWATIVLVVVILLVVYRSPLLALIPLATIALSVWTSLMGIALLTRLPGLDFQVINITNVFVIVVLFGAGTDYCLFLIARYREELARGRASEDALNEAIKQVGGALIASAGTVIVGLGMLWFSTFAKISYTGPAIALSLVIALVASLTLAPVLLHWLRGAVFWPFRPPHLERGDDPERSSLDEMPMHGFWGRVADVVAQHPASILLASALALTPLAVVGARTKSSYDLLSDLRPTEPSVVGARAIQRYFPDGELGPSVVLIHHTGLDFKSDAGIDAVERLSRKLAAVPEVAEVRSVSRPLGKTLGSVTRRLDASMSPGGKPAPRGLFGGLFGKQGLEDAGDRLVLGGGGFAHYVSTKAEAPADRNHITRLELVFRSNPFGSRSMQTLEEIRGILAGSRKPGGLLAGADLVGMGGATVMIDDLKQVTAHDQRLMYVLVTLGVYAILVLLLRRPGVSLYLIATVVVSYLASLGLTDLVFRALHNGPGPWEGLDWKVGFFLFVILVAVGEDYNIFLMSRVIEEEHKFGPIEGTRRAVSHTGGIISSCGLIMAGTFASMLTGSLSALQELGFALGIGVLLDTFVVRPILVPAFVVLIHRGRHRRAEDDVIIPVPIGGGSNGTAKPRRPSGVWSADRYKDGWR